MPMLYHSSSTYLRNTERQIEYWAFGGNLNPRLHAFSAHMIIPFKTCLYSSLTLFWCPHRVLKVFDIDALLSQYLGSSISDTLTLPNSIQTGFLLTILAIDSTYPTVERVIRPDKKAAGYRASTLLLGL